MRKLYPGWEPRDVCCLDEAKSQERDQGAAEAAMRAKESDYGENAPRNRREKRAATAKLRRRRK